ncbi:hypothetical protein [Trujillonella endophytica]|uniref:Uncharacterized protein n=1 Tax=Trujillonella endophytica TaxID=673521 RepID=A0A1H8WRT9_9ACTN|nr:hypothetical protein [Trujillella endophytica]SEP30223.1 hypothetical protein SAMN05660991_04661 [Trujillella endophytica]
MTSTLIARPDRLAAPDAAADISADIAAPARHPGVRPARPLRPPPAAAACPIELRALRTGARTLAGALTGIALDAPCDRARQRAVLAYSRLVLRGLRGADARLADDGVRTATGAVRAALPTFAHDVSAGAPVLAMAWTALADRLDAVVPGVPVHDHGWRSSPLVCERRFRAGAGPARALVPWFLDAAGPAERMTVVRDASRRVRWALRLGEGRHARTMDLVRA